MRVVHIDLRGAQERGELHNRLAAALAFPDYYGRNLDALYDCLSEIEIPIHVHLLLDSENSQISDYAHKIARVFDDASREYYGFSALWTELVTPARV
ncbi:MAG: barstar family protein [Oscillospiraceae bacterium]